MVSTLTSVYFGSPWLVHTIKSNFIFPTADLEIGSILIFLEKDLRLVYPSHFVYDFSRKIVFMLYSIYWSHFIGHVVKVGPETQDFRWIQEPRPRTSLRVGTRDLRHHLKGGTWDPGTLFNMGHEIQDLKMGPTTQDFYHRWDPRLETTISIDPKQSFFNLLHAAFRRKICFSKFEKVSKWEVFHERNQFLYILRPLQQVWRNCQIQFICRFALRIESYL